MVPNAVSAVVLPGYLDLSVWWKQFSFLLLSFILSHLHKPSLILLQHTSIPSHAPKMTTDLDSNFAAF